MLILLLACTANDPSDSSSPDDTGVEQPLCPGWSGLHPGATNTRHTTSQWTNTMGSDIELVATVALVGEEVVRTRTLVGTVPGATIDWESVERFRCDEGGAWFLGFETMERTTNDTDGQVSESTYTVSYSIDQPYFPRTIAAGDNTTVTVSYSINDGAPQEESYPFIVHDLVDVTVPAGTYQAWELTLPLATDRAWYADPEGLVLDHAYELTAFSGG